MTLTFLKNIKVDNSINDTNFASVIFVLRNLGSVLPKQIINTDFPIATFQDLPSQKQSEKICTWIFLAFNFNSLEQSDNEIDNVRLCS